MRTRIEKDWEGCTFFCQTKGVLSSDSPLLSRERKEGLWLCLVEDGTTYFVTCNKDFEALFNSILDIEQ